MHIKAAQHKLCYHAKLGEEKLTFQKAPGKLEPHKVVKAQAGPRSSWCKEAGFLAEAEISRKIPEIPQKERFSPNFRLRNLKIQSPKTCNSVPPAIPYPH